MRWMMPQGAADRIDRTLTGPRQLTRAIPAAGQDLIIVDYVEGVDVLDLPERADGPVVVYGGHRFLKDVLKHRPDLASGVFMDPEGTSHTAVLSRLGDRMLNADARVVPCGEAADRVSRGETLFVRPVMGDKAFAGAVFTPASHDALLDDPDIPVVVNTPQTLIAEYRFVIMDGDVVAGSQYRRDNKLDVRIDVDPACEAFAFAAAAIYAPMRAFVCDVAETPHGPRVVEYNSFSAAGLYACDGREIVKSMTRLLTLDVPCVADPC